MDDITARDLRTLRADIDELKRLVARRAQPAPTVSANALPAELREAYIALVGNEVAREIADELTARVQAELDAVSLRDPARVRARMAALVADMLPSAGEIDLAVGSGPRIVALVGATGVGKTTSIAKLAADCTLRRNRRAGIINLDARRIGAGLQLQVYTDIIDAPLYSADTPDTLRHALARMGDCDLVLIDTPGCNPRDPGSIAELSALLRTTGACETHLVLPASGGRSALVATVEAFASLRVDRVLFTKLDEAVGCGVMLECLRRTSAQLSYIATGQNAASDLQIASRERIADLIIGGSGWAPCVEARA